jgi:DNA-binding beta-propeller fold protein YncE
VKGGFDLPLPPYNSSMSPNGKHIYISANFPAEGVMVVDTASDRIVDVIQPGGQVFDVAVMPDESKLFLAMGYAGLKRIDLQTRESRVVAAVACPFHLGLDPTAQRLYVSYQCGGPGGSPGHDAVDVYDINSEQSVDVIKNLPMVGGNVVVSQRGDAVVLDGSDACSAPKYDHVGCPDILTPRIFHLWNPSGHRPIARLPARLGGNAAFVPQGSRILFVGNDLVVWDWARQMVVERLSDPAVAFESVAFAPEGNRAFISASNVLGVLVFEAEKEECLLPTQGLANLYSGDGTLQDSSAVASLTSARPPVYAPGRIGQAFRFNGKDSLLLASGSDFCAFCQSSLTETLYFKLDSTDGESTVMERVEDAKTRGRRVYKAANNHLVFDAEDAGLSISSKDSLEARRWYHLAIVSEQDHASFYIDGILQGRIGPVTNWRIPHHTRAFFGGSLGKSSFLNGLIDEIAVYNRAFGPDEVKAQSRICAPTK